MIRYFHRFYFHTCALLLFPAGIWANHIIHPPSITPSAQNETQGTLSSESSFVPKEIQQEDVKDRWDCLDVTKSYLENPENYHVSEPTILPGCLGSIKIRDGVHTPTGSLAAVYFVRLYLDGLYGNGLPSKEEAIKLLQEVLKYHSSETKQGIWASILLLEIATGSDQETLKLIQLDNVIKSVKNIIKVHSIYTPEGARARTDLAVSTRPWGERYITFQQAADYLNTVMESQGFHNRQAAQACSDLYSLCRLSILPPKISQQHMEKTIAGLQQIIKHHGVHVPIGAKARQNLAAAGEEHVTFEQSTLLLQELIHQYDIELSGVRACLYLWKIIHDHHPFWGSGSPFMLKLLTCTKTRNASSQACLDVRPMFVIYNNNEPLLQKAQMCLMQAEKHYDSQGEIGERIREATTQMHDKQTKMNLISEQLFGLSSVSQSKKPRDEL